MRHPRRRKRATKEQRRTPCAGCAFPLSHKHHIMPLEHYPENEVTVQLCANCHEIYHIIYDAWNKNSLSAVDTLLYLLPYGANEHHPITAAFAFGVEQVLQISALSPGTPNHDKAKLVKEGTIEDRLRTFLAHVIELGGQP